MSLTQSRYNVEFQCYQLYNDLSLEKQPAKILKSCLFVWLVGWLTLFNIPASIFYKYGDAIKCCKIYIMYMYITFEQEEGSQCSFYWDTNLRVFSFTLSISYINAIKIQFV